MAFAPTPPSYITAAEGMMSSLWSKVTGWFGANPRHQGLPPEKALLSAVNLDPHFIPRAPMSNENLDIGLLAALGHEGYKRGKEITAQSHPEYYRAWSELCRRGGLTHIPQLILVESKEINAGMIHGEEAGFVTTGLLKRLNFREAIAVQGHEVGHEVSDHQSPRSLAYLTLAGLGAILGNMFAGRGGFGSMIKKVENPSRLRRFGHWLFGDGSKQSTFLGAEMYTFTGGFIGSVAARQLTVHPTELDADRKGAMISGDPEGLIAALQKLETRERPHGVWGTIKYYFHFITSGYPTTENRITKLRAIAKTMPRDTQPVYACIPPLPPEVTSPAASALANSAPAAQISNVSGVARVGTAEPQVATAV